MTTMKSTQSPASDTTERGFFGGWRRPRGNSDSTIRRVTSFADLQDHLAETQAAIEGDSSGEDDEDPEATRERHEEYILREEAAREYARQVAESRAESGLGIDIDAEPGDDEADDDEQHTRSGPTSAGTSAFSSRATSRATSRNQSRAASRDTSPTKRRDGETFSTRAVRFSGTNHVVSCSILL